MGLNWNEIKSRALLFSKTWGDACKEDTGIFQPAQSFRDFVEERTAPDGSDLGPRLRSFEK